MSKNSKSLNHNSTDKAAKIFIFSSVFVILALIVGMFFILGGSSSNSADKAAVTSTGSAQVLDLTASTSGYSPTKLTAKAGQPITLKVKTNNSIGCANSLNFSSLGISKTLPPTGTTEIQIPAQASGTTLKGLCSMGMYKVDINIV